MQPFDIYRAAIMWGGCGDARPWLIIDVRPNDVFGCFPIASECYPGCRCYRIQTDHEDFCHTGLTKTCHVHYGAIIDVPAAKLRAGARKGELRGQLREHFCFVADLRS
jgi:hypothetical protein